MSWTIYISADEPSSIPASSTAPIFLGFWLTLSSLVYLFLWCLALLDLPITLFVILFYVYPLIAGRILVWLEYRPSSLHVLCPTKTLCSDLSNYIRMSI